MQPDWKSILITPGMVGSWSGTGQNRAGLTSVHVLQRLLSLVWILKLHIGVAFRQMGVHPFYRHVNHFNFPIGGEYLHDVILDTFLVSLLMCTLVGFGKDSAFSFPFHLLSDLDLELQCCLFSCLCSNYMESQRSC